MTEDTTSTNEYNTMKKDLESYFCTVLTKCIADKPDQQPTRAAVEELITNFFHTLNENNMLQDPEFTIESDQEKQQLILTVTGPEWLVEELNAAREQL